MRDVKSLAAEIETVTERERARLIAWLAKYQFSAGSIIDLEMTADALMVDFITPLIAEAETLRRDVSSLQNDCADEVAARRAEFERHAAEIAANQSRAFGDGARFQTGDAVRKVTGDYRLNGVVVGQATMSTGARRYVVEHRAEGGGSFLHIYAENNLAALQPEGERSDA